MRPKPEYSLSDSCFQLAQPIRLLLEYTGTKYVEKKYVFTLDMAAWLKEKFTLGLDFPNLPYYIEGKHMSYNAMDVFLQAL